MADDRLKPKWSPPAGEISQLSTFQESVNARTAARARAEAREEEFAPPTFYDPYASPRWGSRWDSGEPKPRRETPLPKLTGVARLKAMLRA